MNTAEIGFMKRKGYKKPKRKSLNRSVGGTVTIFLILALLGAFMLLPIVYAIVTAFKPVNEIFIYPPRFWVQHPTIANFIDMIEITQETWVPFERSLFNSLFVSVAGTALYILIASMAAFPLAKKKSKWIGFYYQILVLAILFRPEVTRTPLYIIMSGMGLLNSYLSIILPILAGSFGVFLMRQFMLTIPDEILEAAKVDGANDYRIFFRLIMPLVKPAWMTLTIFTFNSLWNTGDIQYIYNEEMKTLTAVLQSISSAGIARAGAGAAVAVILMIPPVLVFIVSQSSVMETMSHTGLKG
ncbi:ABC-type glycerol-3-phosphate transport system permease component [Anaerotaenia torta]|uniref:carbohydrate ABC transporter permease n=1 Tax=Anaerotaenia torta TaxID=433293 RepID=UPI003D1F46EC